MVIFALGVVWGLSWIVAGVFARALAHPPNPGQIQELFISAIGPSCHPKSIENTRYVLFVLLAFLLGLGVLKAVGKRRHRLLDALGWLAIAAVCVSAWIAQNHDPKAHRYLDDWYVLRVWLFLGPPCVACLFLPASIKVRLKQAFRRVGPGISLLIAGAFTLVYLLPGTFTDGDLVQAFSTILYHLPFSVDEFAAVLNGRTLQVDFFSQYQHVSPYLLNPLWRLFGLTAARFTWMMTALSLACILAVARLFYRVSGSGLLSLLYFLSWLAASFFPIYDQGLDRYSAFSCYTIGPLRYFGWLMTAVLLGWALEKPKHLGRSICVMLFGALAAINNADFSLPAFLVASATLVAASSRPLRAFVAAIASFAAMLALNAAYAFMRSGSLPRWSEIMIFQRAFALYGFAPIPTPAWGLHVLIIGLLLVSAIFGAWRLLSKREESPLVPGLHFYTGMAGLGAFTYFMSRSSWEVLNDLFPIGALALLLWVADFVRQDRLLNSFAGWALAALALIPISFLSQLPNPVLHFERLRTGAIASSQFESAQEELTHIIQSVTRPGEKVGILYPYGHLLAVRAGVINVSPFAEKGSILLRRQVEIFITAMESGQVRFLFGDFPEEVRQWLQARGFRRQAVRGDFETWASQ